MRSADRTFVFRMVLYADEPRVALQLDPFDEPRIGVDPHGQQACLAEILDVVVVEFVAVAVAVARSMLKKGVIDEQDFLRVEEKMREKFRPVLGGFLL